MSVRQYWRGQIMRRQGKGWLVLTVAAVFMLTACEEGLKTKSGPGGTKSSRAAVSVESEVEAPEVFRLTSPGLWDGRPSLGGVWVAHPSVKDPERVIIRNTKNNKSVVGALFRRERDLPGPALQVSSDAAEDLGMLAGAPADLSVVALRKVEAPVLTDEDETLRVADSAAPAEGAADTKAAASSEAPAVTAGAGAATATAAETGTAAAKPARTGGFFSRMFGRNKAPASGAAATPAGEGVAESAAPGAIEQSTLDPVTVTAAAGIDAAEARQQSAPAKAAPTLKRAYIQIGIFSEQANAKRAGEQMKKAGMTATIVPDKSQGKSFWRVIVGPAASVAERDALVARVKGVGYPDAYPVSK